MSEGVVFIIKYGPDDRAARVCFNPAHVISVTECFNPSKADVTLVSGEVITVSEAFDSSIQKLFNVRL